MAGRDFTWLERLYNDQYNTVYKLVRRRLAGYSSEDVNDIIQETFLLAWEKDIHDHPKLEAWIITTANNLCLNHIHSNWRQQNSRPYDSAVESDVSMVEMMETLRAELSPQDFWLIDEYCLKGTSVKELSQKTGRSVSRIYARILQIRKHIQMIFPIFLICLEVFRNSTT